MELLLVVLLCISLIILSYAKLSWKYRMDSITSSVSTPDLIAIELRLERFDRANFGISGFIDIKANITDETYFSLTIWRSARGNDNYQIMPYGLNRVPFSKFMTTIYAPYIMDEFAKCVENPIHFEGAFVGPLQPMRMELKRCLSETNNMVSYMQPGYYKILMRLSGQVVLDVNMASKVDIIEY